MKFCPVVPPACYIKLPTPPRGMFAFATHCYQGGLPGYGDFFRSWVATALQSERGPLVIDCPIYEGGEFLDRPELKRVEDIMKPDFLIVPDVRGNMEATIERFQLYAHRLGEATTGVLQGKTWIELEQCFHAYYDSGCRKFAIPKDVVKIDVFRSDLCTQMVAVHDDIQIHLLGGDWPYVDEAKAGALAQVVSFDSAEPFNCAYEGLDIAKTMPPKRTQSWMSIAPNILGGSFDHHFHGNIEVVERLAKCN